MTTENALPTLEEITKQLEEANAKKDAKEVDEIVKEVGDKVDEDPDLKDVEKGLGKTPETPLELVTEEKKETKEDPWSKRFAAMTRMDKKRRQAEAQLAQKQAEFEARMRAFEEKEASGKKINSALDALKHHGYSYEDATYALLGAPNKKEEDPVESKVRSHVDPLDQKMRAIEEQIASLNEATRKFEAAQQQQAEREIRYAIEAFTKDGDYPYMQALGKEAFDNVYDFMCEYWVKHKQTLTYKQACDKVEGYYKRIGSLVSTKQDTATDAKVPTKRVPATIPTAKTLTQSHGVGTRSKPDYDKMSPNDAKDAIAKAFLKYRET